MPKPRARLTATPLLTWNWVPGASGYQVRLTDLADVETGIGVEDPRPPEDVA